MTRPIDTAKYRACSPMLPEPGNEVVVEMCDEIDALRAEVARLQADQKQGGIDYCKLRDLADERWVEICALKAKLERYEADLTDEQAARCYPFGTGAYGQLVGLAHAWDAAIRKVRGES